MSTILFATHNPAKVKRYLQPLANIGIHLVTANDIDLIVKDPVEDGSNEWENAKIKATAYFLALSDSQKQTIQGTLSLDTGVYFEGVTDDEQPGKHVQRIAGAGGEHETDDERFEKMGAFYSGLATRYGGFLNGYFLDSFCFFDGKNYHKVEAKRTFVLTSTMFFKDVHFPISSFYTVNGVPYHQLSPQQMQQFIQPSVNALVDLLRA